MATAKFAYNLLSKTPHLKTRFQESVAVENKIGGILSRVVSLEEHFNSRPSDVAEQRRRDDLIWYAMTPPLHCALTFLKRAQAHRRSTAIVG